MKRILLNWLPPAKTFLPAPSMSVLKTVLSHNGYDCSVIYWNMLLDDVISEYLFGKRSDDIDEINALGIFYAYIAIKCNDRKCLIQQEAILRSIKPQYENLDDFDYQEHIVKCVNRLHKTIVTELHRNSIEECLFFGMYMSLFQWVPASVISQIIKEEFPMVYIAIGGIGNSKEAKAFMGSFNCFDIAMWGEGEQAILELARYLSSNKSSLMMSNHNPIPHSISRNLAGLISSDTKKNYWDLSEIPYLDYSDYFLQYKGDKSLVSIPIEGSRGCHWNKCKFCFLNQGYKYRKKSIAYILSEIKHYIETYRITSISFLDNDVIGNNLDEFDNLLDGLIKIKEDFPDFKIVIAEIVSKGISKNYIRKMHLAGFVHVQIGYESPSDSILAKINKKNTFASNLLFIKWANVYSIHVGGMNILRGLFDETDEDILEAIKNVHFLRFYKYEHNISSLAINDASRYYKEISEDELDADSYTDSIKEMLPNSYVSNEFSHSIYQYIRKYQNPMWKYFQIIDKYYADNLFTYNVYKIGESCMLYSEYCNSREICTIKFDINELEWKLLETCNEKVLTIGEIYNIFPEDKSTIDNSLAMLNKYGLVYYSPTHQECISIINPLNIL